MATRRRIGVSAASTEAARRQLMQPVSCWERVWATPQNVPNGSSIKAYKWVRTDKVQQFSDDEGGADEPLAPLPDEPDVVDGDEEMDQEEQVANGAESVQPPGTRAATASQEDTPSKPPSPKPQLSLQATNDQVDNTGDVLDALLKPLDSGDDGGVPKTVVDEGMELDMPVLGTDGLKLDNSHELGEVDGGDGLVG
ncbi:hypothetical protein AMATHDRAFT_72601 [Amanita thiersii Skay4041]|uniref:Uncharacterized protein n=1 Tax=Amanita thiersii Skay4041 TaxID=703135 RepID=A0A2A9NYX7_9AGAR|nr:hypothetical protein AMATHDRAFT_72601 [Amanita thiersii Skay4041]